MAQAERSRLYHQLKEAGFQPTKHFRHYSLEELEHEWRRMQTKQAVPAPQHADPTEQPTQRRGQEDTPIRTDEHGRIWYQEEVRKKTTAAKRAYRVHREIGSNVKTIKIDSGDGYTETIEVPGDERKPLEVKVGLPTWQHGIYKSPQFPWRIACCRGKQGFVREDIEDFFGGPDVLPESITKVYVGSKICYDIRSVTTAVQREYNMLQRKGAQV